jgi:DNA-binding transcriptional LysR family regulator
MIDLNLLETFIAVVKEGSFRAASKTLFKAQPVVSYQIKKLETYLGVELFDRSKYRATLTKQGELVFTKALNLLNQASLLESVKTSVEIGQEAHVSMSISSLYPIALFSEKLKSVQKLYPDTVFSVTIDTLAGLDKVKNKDVDFSISEQEVDDLSIKESVCFSMKMVLVCSCGHDLSKLEKVSLQDLSQFSQITVKSSGDMPVKDRGVFKSAKQWIVSDMTTKKQLISDGFGWGYLPDHLVACEIDSGKLFEIQLSAMNSTGINFRKVMLKNKSMGPVLNALWSCF